MAYQSVAGYVGCGVDANRRHGRGRAGVQCGHHLDGTCEHVRRDLLSFARGGNDAGPDRLSQDKHIAGPGFGVGDDPVGVDDTGDGKAILGLVIGNRVPADDLNSRLGGFLGAST